MSRFFIPKAQFHGTWAFVEGADHHHLSHVLRKNVGEQIEILNGKGEEYTARIIAFEAERTKVEICEATGRVAEPQVKINLVQSMPKADKFEWIIQKNTELGVDCFQPILSERSMVKLDASTREKKQQRWQKIIQEAAQQSGRGIIPHLEPVASWSAFLKAFPQGLVVIPWESEQTQSLRHVLTGLPAPPERISVIIGPEGGFSQEEVAQLGQLGAVPVTLGPRILRTETAGLVAATAILYQFGEMG